MSGKTFSWDMLEGTHLHTLTLVKQHCDLVLIEDRLGLGDEMAVAREHFLGNGFQHLAVMETLFLTKGLEIGLIGHIEKLELG